MPEIRAERVTTPGLMQQLIEAGLGGVVMHFRGCSGEPNRQCQSYHCGHTTDITWLLHQLAQNHPEQALFTVGFSIGGAALLNTLAQEELPEALQLSIAISPPLEPRAGAIRMNQGFSRVYQHVLVGDCVASAKAKLAAGVPLPVDPEKLERANTFWDFDNDVTAPIHGFSSADDYYNRAASRPRLKDIERACHIIHAVDDPFFQPSMVPSEEELSEHVTLEISQTGGHVAFVQGSPFAPFYWLEKRIRQLIVDKLSY